MDWAHRDNRASTSKISGVLWQLTDSILGILTCTWYLVFQNEYSDFVLSRDSGVAKSIPDV